jgi:hypothetical protein
MFFSLLNVDVVLYSMFFPFPPSNSKLIDDFCINRQNAATIDACYFFSLTMCIANGAPNPPALIDDARRTKKSAK